MVNNVAQVWLVDRKKQNTAMGVIVGEVGVGSGCTVGAVCGAVEIAEQMGATSTVTWGTATGAGTLAGLCTLGAMVATYGYYLATK